MADAIGGHEHQPAIEPQMAQGHVGLADPMTERLLAAIHDAPAGHRLSAERSYLDRYVVDRLATIEGVASVDVYGERPFAVRIWIEGLPAHSPSATQLLDELAR